MGPFFPKITSRKNPTTVGGNTIGNVNTPSTNPFSLPLYPATNQAAAIPKKNVIIVAVNVVFIEIHKGEKSIFKPLMPLLIYFTINTNPYFSKIGFDLLL